MTLSPQTSFAADTLWGKPRAKKQTAIRYRLMSIIVSKFCVHIILAKVVYPSRPVPRNSGRALRNGRPKQIHRNFCPIVAHLAPRQNSRRCNLFPPLKDEMRLQALDLFHPERVRHAVRAVPGEYHHAIARRLDPQPVEHAHVPPRAEPWRFHPHQGANCRKRSRLSRASCTRNYRKQRKD